MVPPWRHIGDRVEPARDIVRGGIGGGEVDDPIGEAVACAVALVALESLLDLGAQAGEVGVVAHRPGEIVIELGQALLAQLEEADLEVGRLAGREQGWEHVG